MLTKWIINYRNKREDMKKISIIGVLTCTALLSSCGLYNKYDREDVKLDVKGIVRDPLSATDTLAVADTTCLGNLPWRTVFTDPCLQTLIDSALHRNTDLLSAVENVKIAQAQLTASKLAFLPSIAFTPSGTLSSWDGGSVSKGYSLPVSASWNVDLWGNLLSKSRSARTQLLASQYYQQVVRSQIISGIANCYYTLLMLDKQLGIVDEMASLTKDTWEMMKKQKQLSMATETAVQSAEAAYYSVLSNGIDIRRSIRETENSLSLLLRQSPQQISRGRLEDQSLPTDLSVGVPLKMLDNRPDVHAAEMSLAQCFYGVQQARQAFFPSLNITAQAAFTNSAGGAIINPGKWFLTAVGSLTQPIFANGKIVAGLKAAKSQYEQAYLKYEQTILNAGGEVSNALVTYNSAHEKSLLETKRVNVLEKNVEMTKLLYKQSSNTTYLEVISAQQNLLNAQLSLIQDNFTKMQAVVTLYQALGGGRN